MGRVPSETGDMGAPGAHPHSSQDSITAVDDTAVKAKEAVEGTSHSNGSHTAATQSVPPGTEKDARTRKTSRSAEPFDQAEREEMERLLEELRGHLGMFASYRCCFHDALLAYSLVSDPFLGRRR